MGELPLVAVLVVKIAVVLTGVLLAVAYLVYLERRALAFLQLRVGPNRVGPAGLLQPLADAVKLVGKEMTVPDRADRFLFRLAPLVVMVSAFLVYAFIPLGPNFKVLDVNAALLMILAISSLGVYGIVLAGFSSNNRYATLGAMRSASQFIAYEVTLVLCALAVMVTTGSMNITEIVDYQRGMPLLLRQPLAFVFFFIAGLAETNRLPFDLPEAESELTGGYHTEYSGMGFGLFFLGEYTNILTVSLMTSLLFLGGWNGPLAPGLHWLLLKTYALIYVFFWVRGTLPRLRYDQLMALGWKVLLPLATLNLLVSGAVKVLVP